MRKPIVLGAAVLVAVLAGGCAKSAQPAPYSSSAMAVLGTTGQSASAPSARVATPADPVAIERIPSGSGLLVNVATGVTGVSETKAIALARKAAVTTGAKSVSAVHVTISSDISRPSNPQAGTGAVSAWMVTFHEVSLPAGGTTNGQVGSSTVFLDSNSGKVIRVLNYVPTSAN